MQSSRIAASSGRARLSIASVGLVLCATLTAGDALALPVCSTGVDGTVTVGSNGIRVNVYYAAPDPAAGATIVPAGSRSIPIDVSLGGQARNLHGAVSPQIAAGDVLLVMQTIGAAIDPGDNHQDKGRYGDGPDGLQQAGFLNDANFTVGRYEFVVATGPVAAGVIPIEGSGAASGLVHRYENSDDVTATSGLRRYQVVKVPQFAAARISARIVPDRWNGRWGGVAAIDVRNGLTFTGGAVSADGRGYRGGQWFGDLSTAANGNFGFKGEGIAGSPQRLFSKALLAEEPGTDGRESGPIGYPGVDDLGPAGTAWTRDAGLGAPGTAGSAGGGAEAAGGGGGGHFDRGGAGGDGPDGKGTKGIGGGAFPQYFDPEPGRLVMGGGGGASNGDDLFLVDRTVSSGQAGGGIVILRSNTISGSGTISARGDSGGTTFRKGGGGGGAGGSLLIHTDGASVGQLTLSTEGGNGGSSLFDEDAGGGGGSGGIIWLSDTEEGSGELRVDGGEGGDGGNHDGKDGDNGKVYDDATAAAFDCGFVTVGIAKALTSQTRVGTDGVVFDLSFVLTVENLGSEPAINLQIIDDLARAFPDAVSISLQGAPQLGAFSGPAMPYDGSSQPALLSGRDTFPGNTRRTISYTVRVDFGANTGPFETQAEVSSAQIGGGFLRVLDLSDEGFEPDPDSDGNPSESFNNGGDSSENDPTPVRLDLDVLPAECEFSPEQALPSESVTATCSGVESGGTITIQGMACDAEDDGSVTCSGVAADIGSNPDVVTTDSAGNSITVAGDFIVLFDADADGDGIADIIEGTGDTDGDGLADFEDPDSDNDTIPDAAEEMNQPPLTGNDTDGDDIDDAIDVDSTGGQDADNDGVDDRFSLLDSDGDGIANLRDLDADGDGIQDRFESAVDTDGDGIGDYLDTDSDGDGIGDQFEADNLPQESRSDVDGDGIDDAFDVEATGGLDLNGNGFDDAAEPVDSDDDSRPDFRDVDADDDGIADAVETRADTEGDGVGDWRDLDSDGDGVLDSAEGPSGEDGDSDGIDDAFDADTSGSPDANGDGVSDASEWPDYDLDGVPDFRDLDSDNDSLNDVDEAGLADVDGDGLADSGQAPLPADQLPNGDGDGLPDLRDLDADGDGIFDIAQSPDAALDADNDGQIDDRSDSDGDGIPDVADGMPTAFGDGLDFDGDGISDEQEGASDRVDTDGDGTPDFRDPDSDGDGIPDSTEGTEDSDGDGIGNWRDEDSDGDGVPDANEGTGDSDGDGIPNRLDADDQRLTTAIGGAGAVPVLLLLALLTAAAMRRWPAPTSTLAGVVVMVAYGFPASVEAQQSSCRAANAEFEPCVYAAAGFGVTKVEPEGSDGGWSPEDTGDTGFKVLLGYQFMSRISVELSYVDGGSAELQHASDIQNERIPDAAIGYQTPALMAVGWLNEPDSRWNAFAKAGISAISNSVSDDRIPFEKQSDVQFAFGVGAQRFFGERFFLRGELDIYSQDHYYAGMAIGVDFGAGNRRRAASSVPPRDPGPSTSGGAETERNQALECTEVIRVVEGVSFEGDSTELTPAARDVLDEMAGLLRQSPLDRVRIFSYADESADAARNTELSNRRARAVESYLISAGVDADQLSYRSVSEPQPLLEGETGEGGAINRRVELQWFTEECQ